MIHLICRSLAGSPRATPIEAIQYERERISVPAEMINGGEHFVLQVQGDSMIDAGILDGDYVVIKRGDQPQPSGENRRRTGHGGRGDVEAPA